MVLEDLSIWSRGCRGMARDCLRGEKYPSKIQDVMGDLDAIIGPLTHTSCCSTLKRRNIDRSTPLTIFGMALVLCHNQKPKIYCTLSSQSGQIHSYCTVCNLRQTNRSASRTKKETENVAVRCDDSTPEYREQQHPKCLLCSNSFRNDQIARLPPEGMWDCLDVSSFWYKVFKAYPKVPKLSYSSTASASGMGKIFAKQ